MSWSQLKEQEGKSALIKVDQLELILNHGGFQLKGVSFSGDDPPDTLSDDGITIHVAGMEDLKLSKSQLCEVQKEHNIEVRCSILNDKVLEEVKKWYQFSQYLIYQNLHTFKSVVRIMALVIKFCSMRNNQFIYLMMTYDLQRYTTTKWFFRS